MYDKVEEDEYEGKQRVESRKGKKKKGRQRKDGEEDGKTERTIKNKKNEGISEEEEQIAKEGS